MTGDANDGSARLWLAGAPMVGERRLDDTEASTLSSRLRNGLARVRRDLIARRLALAMMLVLPVAFIAWNPGGQPLPAAIAAAVGVLLMVVGVMGALWAVALPASGWHRWIFSGAIAAFIGAMLAEQRLPELWFTGLLLSSVVVVFAGGTAYLWARLRVSPRLAANLRRVGLDVEGRRVLVFRDSHPSTDGEPTAEAEVLAVSGLLWRVEGESLQGWDFVEPELVAESMGDSEPIAATSVPSHLLADGFAYRSRRLSSEELVELRRHVARAPRRIAAESLIVAWVAAVLARLVQWIFEGRVGPELSAAAWIAVGLIVLGRTAHRLRQFLRVRADLAAGQLIRAKRFRRWDAEDNVDVEVLPRSGVIWTESGQPADWRTS